MLLQVDRISIQVELSLAAGEVDRAYGCKINTLIPVFGKIALLQELYAISQRTVYLMALNLLRCAFGLAYDQVPSIHILEPICTIVSSVAVDGPPITDYP